MERRQSFISGFHSETEQRVREGGSQEGEIAMKRPSPLSTKLYIYIYIKKRRDEKNCLFHSTAVENRAWPASTHVRGMLKHPESHHSTGHYFCSCSWHAHTHTHTFCKTGLSPSYTGHLMRNDHCWAFVPQHRDKNAHLLSLQLIKLNP